MAGTGTLIPGLDDLLADMRKRLAGLEQRMTNPSNVVGNGMEVNFGRVIIGPPVGGDVLATTVSSPSNVTASASTLYDVVYADIAWTAPADGSAADYEVVVAEKNTATGAYSAAFVRRTVSTSIRIEGLEPSRTYGVKVSAINRIGRISDASPSPGYLDFNTPRDATIPPQTIGLKATAGYASVTLQWTESTAPDVANGAGMYEVQYGTDVNFVGATSVKTSSTIASINGLTTGVAYYFRVRAIDASAQEGPWSDTASATPGEPPSATKTDAKAPGSSPAPALVSGVSFIVARWAAVANADPVTYDVHISPTNGFVPDSSTKVAEVQATSAFIRTLANGTVLSQNVDYYVRIVARDPDGSAAPSTQAGPQRLGKANTADIVVGAITADSGIIASLDAGVITVGTLNADRLGASSIRTDQLVVAARTQGENLLPNGSLSDWPGGGDARGWFRAGGSATYFLERSKPFWSTPGPVNFAHAGGGDGHLYYEISSDVPVVAGDTLYGEVTAGYSASDAALFMRALFFNADRAFLSSSDFFGGAMTPPANPAHRYSGRVGVPGGASFMRLQVITRGGPHIVWSNAIVTRAANQVSIADGSVVARHIVAGQINSDMITTAGLNAAVIRFGTMHGDRVEANTLDVNRIRTSTLDGRTITLAPNGFLRGLNSGGGTGWLLHEEGFKIYDGAGNVRVGLFRDGNATFRGTVNAESGSFSGNLTSSATITGGTFQTGDSGTNRAIINGNRVTFQSSSNSPNPAFIEVTNNVWGATVGQDLRIDGGRGGGNTNKFSTIFMSAGQSGVTLEIATGGAADSRMRIFSEGDMQLDSPGNITLGDFAGIGLLPIYRRIELSEAGNGGRAHIESNSAAGNARGHISTFERHRQSTGFSGHSFIDTTVTWAMFFTTNPVVQAHAMETGGITGDYVVHAFSHDTSNTTFRVFDSRFNTRTGTVFCDVFACI